MLRACLTIVAVAIVSSLLTHLRDAQGQRSTAASVAPTSWVRTVDGWESSGVLQLKPRAVVAPSLHPAVVASFQLGVSLFALIALPTTNRAMRDRRLNS